MLPLRDIVVFPHMIVPLFVGREKSVRALEEVMADDRQILLSSQIDPSVDDPGTDQIYRVGVLANVLQLLKLPDGTVKVLVEGKTRIKITDFLPNDRFFEAHVEPLTESLGDKASVDALIRAVAEEFERYAKIKKNIPEEALAAVAETREPARLADLVAGHLGIEVGQKQELLETLEVSERLEKVYGQMQGEMSVLQVEKKIKSRVKTQMEKTQREYYLNEQMKAIQRELGDGEEGQNEIAELEERIRKTQFSKEARDKAEAELKKLKSMSPMSAEATVVRNYLDWLLGVPWGVKSRVKKDLFKSQEVLDKDHYGLEKVKERIVEYLAVQARSAKLKGPILCLVGPPGVGKTSLGRSVAKATGREFIRISLGGVRDESEIRGHRRTYIGSMPGKIIQALKKAKTTNPLILLDEIDKMGQDFRGDPASAMLEVLDPEQNATFVDHYLEVEYDLSNVMFITTANSYNMPGPLLDRMEIISLAGYTEDEKREIAKQHLIPKQITNHGLRKGEFKITDAALAEMIRTYTREAGVRNLEREIAKLARKAVTEIVKKKGTAVEVTPEKLEEYLGVKRFRYGLAEKEDQVGVVTGLAWTSVGGDLSVDRGAQAARQGPHEDHRQTWRRDEGIDRGGGLLRPLHQPRAWGEAAEIRSDRHPRPRPRRCHTERRPLGRSGDGHLHRFGADGHSRPQGHRHDRRGHVARQRAGHRRAKGKAAGRPAWRDQDGSDPGRKRQGSDRDSGQRPRRVDHHSGQPRERGAQAGPRPRPRTGGMGRGGRRSRRRSRQGRGRGKPFASGPLGHTARHLKNRAGGAAQPRPFAHQRPHHGSGRCPPFV